MNTTKVPDRLHFNIFRFKKKSENIYTFNLQVIFNADFNFTNHSGYIFIGGIRLINKALSMPSYNSKKGWKPVMYFDEQMMQGLFKALQNHITLTDFDKFKFEAEMDQKIYKLMTLDNFLQDMEIKENV